MKRLTVATAAILAALAMSVSAFAFGGPNPNPNAHANCHNAFVAQDSGGVMAGGGPKAGETGPLNCDHYWQTIGAIGNGAPPGSG
jgi:hypothetical protein